MQHRGRPSPALIARDGLWRVVPAVLHARSGSASLVRLTTPHAGGVSTWKPHPHLIAAALTLL